MTTLEAQIPPHVPKYEVCLLPQTKGSTHRNTRQGMEPHHLNLKPEGYPFPWVWFFFSPSPNMQQSSAASLISLTPIFKPLSKPNILYCSWSLNGQQNNSAPVSPSSEPSTPPILPLRHEAEAGCNPATSHIASANYHRAGSTPH